MSSILAHDCHPFGGSSCHCSPSCNPLRPSPCDCCCRNLLYMVAVATADVDLPATEGLIPTNGSYCDVMVPVNGTVVTVAHEALVRTVGHVPDLLWLHRSFPITHLPTTNPFPLPYHEPGVWVRNNYRYFSNRRDFGLPSRCMKGFRLRLPPSQYLTVRTNATVMTLCRW